MSETTETTNDTPAPTATNEMVSKAELDRVLADMHKFKTTAKEATERLKTLEDQKLKETQDWKTLAERREQEATEARQEAERIKSSYVNGTKFSAVKEAAVKAGLVPHALSDLESIDLSGVQLETTNTGKISVLGADSFVNQLKALKPHWFGAVKTTVNTNIPGVKSSEPVGRSELIKLSLEASKSGDYTAYKQALETYRQQQK